MNKIKKLYFIFLLLLCSCSTTRISDTIKVIFCNNSENELLLECAISGVGTGNGSERDILKSSYGVKDSIVYSFDYKRVNAMGEPIGMPSRYFLEGAILYNISDTTSYIICNISTTYDWQINKTDKSQTYIFTPTDSIFSVVQKDYSMLEKFPEYYGN